MSKAKSKETEAAEMAAPVETVEESGQPHPGKTRDETPAGGIYIVNGKKVNAWGEEV